MMLPFCSNYMMKETSRGPKNWFDLGDLSNYRCSNYMSLIVLSKAGVKQMTKASLALGLEKSIFVHGIFMMDRLLPAQGNLEI